MTLAQIALLIAIVAPAVAFLVAVGVLTYPRSASTPRDPETVHDGR